MLQSSGGTLQMAQRLASPTWAPARRRVILLPYEKGAGRLSPTWDTKPPGGPLGLQASRRRVC